MLDHKYKVRVSHVTRAGRLQATNGVSKREGGRRKRRWLVLGVSLLLFVGVVWLVVAGVLKRTTDQQAAGDLIKIRVSELSGGVQMQRAGAADFEDIKEEQDLLVGMTIRTRTGGRASLNIKDNIFLRLDSDSRLLIKGADDELIDLELVGGDLWSYRRAGAPSLRVETPNVEVVSGQNIDKKNINNLSSHNKSTTIYNFSGELQLTAKVGLGNDSGGELAQVVLPHKKQVTLKAGTLPKTAGDFVIEEIDTLFKEGEWYHFNREKDRSL